MQGVRKSIQKPILLSTLLLFPLLLIGAAAILIQRSQREFQESTQWVNHTLEVLNRLQTMRRHFINAEAGQRAFVVSGNPTFLEVYEPAYPQIPIELKALRNLTLDNEKQKKNLTWLEPLLLKNVRDWEKAVATRKTSGQPGNSTLVTADLPSILTLFANMQKEEEQLLGTRQDQVARQFAFNTRIAVGMLLANLVVAGVILYLWRRLSRAEQLVTVCAWSKTIHYGNEWLSFEEYLRRRFNVQISHGMSPAEAERLTQQLREVEGVGASSNKNEAGPYL